MAKITKIKIGDRFEKLIVIADNQEFLIEKNGHKRKLLTVKCDCGFEFSARLDYLSRGDTKQCKDCRYAQATTVSVGEIYDQLTVIGFVQINNKKQAICQCSCGNTVNRRAELLTHINKTNNCGCLPRGGWTGVGKLSTCTFNIIKRNARVRNISFNITIEEVWQLYQKQGEKCALTGVDIGFHKLTSGSHTASLDRINSKLDYSIHNVQWVHKDINLMKMDLDQSRFIELCQLVANTVPTAT